MSAIYTVCAALGLIGVAVVLGAVGREFVRDGWIADDAGPWSAGEIAAFFTICSVLVVGLLPGVLLAFGWPA